jgi:hypothetical protein
MNGKDQKCVHYFGQDTRKNRLLERSWCRLYGSKELKLKGIKSEDRIHLTEICDGIFGTRREYQFSMESGENFQ